MRQMKHLLLIVPLVLSLLVAPVLAQETPPDDLPTTVDVDGAAAILIAALVTIFGRYIHSPLTVFLVSLTKRLPFLKTVSAQTQTVWIAGILWVLTAIAQYVGFGEQWGNFMVTFAQVAPPIAGFINTLIRAPQLYEEAKEVNAPIVSHSRTPRDSPAPTGW